MESREKIEARSVGKFKIKVWICITVSITFLFPLAASIPSHSVPDAVKTLRDSNLTAMSLIMKYGGLRVTPTRSLSLTIFAPSDAVFRRHNQPSLDQLRLHYSPLRLSLRTLGSLREGTKIPTLNLNQFLVVTSSPPDYSLSINGVEISDGSPLYDDGSLVIYKVDKFFDTDFKTPHGVYGNLHCTAPIKAGYTGSRDGLSFKVVSNALRLRGYSAMASFLDTQVGGVGTGALMTIFAPADEALNHFTRQFEEYSSLLLGHFVPCKIAWVELAYLDDGVQLQTYVEGFKINISRSGDDLRLNGVPVMDKDIFTSNWLAIHGIKGVLASRKNDDQDGSTKSSSSGYLNSSLTFWLCISSIIHILFSLQ